MIAYPLSGCAYITGATCEKTFKDDVDKSPEETLTRLDISTFEFSHLITCRSMRTSNISIILTGTTDLVDGTILQSQLYENYIFLAWWPADREYSVEDGRWEIKVLLKEIESSEELIPESYYFIKIWVKDGPSIIDGVIWDTIGPPGPRIAEDK